MTPAQMQREAGREELAIQVRESLIMMRLLEKGMKWQDARDLARELAKKGES